MANTVEKSMRESLRRYAEEGISPSEYGPRVKLAAAHLKFRPTSRNHMNQAEQVEANYFGATPQICLFDEDADVQRRNIERTENFIGGLGTPELSWNRKCIYWDNVSSADIRDKLLKDFEFSVHETLFSQQMFLKWLEKAELQKWNVIVAGLGDVDKNTAAASVPQNSSHYWKVGGYTLEKAERTRKTEGPQKAGLLNIGVLAHRPDRLADISSEIIEKHKNNNARFELNDTICAVRQEAERDQIPQLVIYRIDKDSAPKSSDSQRAPLNCSSDIIGLWFCLPGDKKDKKYDGEVTVRIKNKEQQ
jgi:hypothetical protein